MHVYRRSVGMMSENLNTSTDYVTCQLYYLVLQATVEMKYTT